MTVERARLLEDLATPASDDLEAVAVPDAVKLTLHLGRRARGDGGPAHVVAVAALHRHGVAGATALLGVDGTARGRRERARLVGRNARVPLLVLSVADAGTLRPALAELARLLPAPVATLERVRVLRRAGAAVAPPRAEPPPGTPSGARVKVTVIASEQALVHRRLVDALRRVRRGGRDRAARHVGLPRRPPAPRRRAARAAPPGARRDGRRGRPGPRGALVAARRGGHREHRPRHAGVGPLGARALGHGRGAGRPAWCYGGRRRRTGVLGASPG